MTAGSVKILDTQEGETVSLCLEKDVAASFPNHGEQFMR